MENTINCAIVLLPTAVSQTQRSKANRTAIHWPQLNSPCDRQRRLAFLYCHHKSQELICRSLTLGYVHRSFCYSDDHDGHLHSSIGTLTQLTAFSSGWQSSARCFDSILKLVRLESLLVELSTWHKKDSIPPGLPKLTCLLVHGPNRRQVIFSNNTPKSLMSMFCEVFKVLYLSWLDST